jgi:hypothetical protein
MLVSQLKIGKNDCETRNVLNLISKSKEQIGNFVFTNIFLQINTLAFRIDCKTLKQILKQYIQSN